jgi:hypothetical protein
MAPMRVQRTLILAAVLIAPVGARPASAAEWRYCIAAVPAQHKIYMSAAFPTDTAMETLEAAFSQALDRAQIQHDSVQCPRGDQQSIAAMKLQAIKFNRDSGNKVVEFNWQP